MISRFVDARNDGGIWRAPRQCTERAEGRVTMVIERFLARGRGPCLATRDLRNHAEKTLYHR